MSDSKAIAIIARLVEYGCEEASEIDSCISCRYCGAFLQVNEPHCADCAFVEATAFLQENAIGTAQGTVKRFRK